MPVRSGIDRRFDGLSTDDATGVWTRLITGCNGGWRDWRVVRSVVLVMEMCTSIKVPDLANNSSRTPGRRDVDVVHRA